MERAQSDDGVPNAWFSMASLKDQSVPEARFEEACEVSRRLFPKEMKSSTFLVISRYID